MFPGILLMPAFLIAAGFWAFGPTWSWIPFNSIFWLLAAITFVAGGPRRVILMSPMSAQSTSGTFSLTLLLSIGVAAVLIFHERYWEPVYSMMLTTRKLSRLRLDRTQSTEAGPQEPRY